MFKIKTNIVTIFVLLTTLQLSSITSNKQIFEDFTVGNFKAEKPVEIEKKQIGIFSKILNKFTPKKVKELKENHHVRPILSEQEQARIVSSFFSNQEHNDILEYDEIKNLELVKGLGQSGLSLVSVLNALVPTYTMGGKTTIANYLVNPVTDVDELEKRQYVIEILEKNPRHAIKLQYYIEKLKLSESSLLEFFSDTPMVSPVEDKMIYSQKPLVHHVINRFSILYNVSTIIPAIGYTLSVPLVLGSLSLWLAKTLISSTTNRADVIIENMINGSRELHPHELLQNALVDHVFTKKEIVDAYLAWRKSLTREELDEQLQLLMKKMINSESIEEFGLLEIFGGMPVENQEEILKGTETSFSSCIDFVSTTLKEIDAKTKGKGTKNIALYMSIPSLFLGFRQFSLMHLIALKAKEVQKYLIDVAEYIYMSERIIEIIEETPEFVDTTFALYFAEFKNNSNLKCLKSLLASSTFRSNASAWSNWGNVFVTLKEMEKQKKHFIPLIKAVGEVDMYCGLANLMRTHRDNDVPVQFCFAEYVKNETPIIQATDFWNPFMLTHKSIENIVTNSINFDTKNKQSGIFTGPNTCGKTTVIIGLMLNAILAQTFGIAAAKRFVLTPFSKFNATLTVSTDGAIGDSRFKSEVREAQKIVQRIENARQKGLFTLTIQDEIFTGTNQQDGSVAAYKFLTKIGTFENNIGLTATHYEKLTTLGNPFVNFKINAEVKNGNEVVRYYTVSKGISTLNIAHIITAHAGLS